MAAAASNLDAFIASEKSCKKKFFRKTFIYRDVNWQNPTTVTVTNTNYGLLGSVGMLHSLYKQKLNFGQLGLAVFQTATPTKPRKQQSNGSGGGVGNGGGYRTSADKPTYEAVAMFDLDSFISNFVQHDGLAKFLEARCTDIIAEWRADNQSKEKMGCRVPIERVYQLAKYSWDSGRSKKREESEYDLQLSKYSRRRSKP